MTDGVSVRPARADELADLQAIELAAGELFREIGMVAVDRICMRRDLTG